MTDKYLIYKHTSPSGKSYIGQTKDYEQRCKLHQQKGCPIFYRAIKKYGWENFTHDILQDNLSLEDANKLEQDYIIKYNTIYPHGYNIRSGGLNQTIHPLTREKISKANKGKKKPMVAKFQTGRRQSHETIEKRVQHIRGKSRPDNVKIRASETHKGKIVSDETRLKQSQAKQGRKLSPESIAKRQATRKARREAAIAASLV